MQDYVVSSERESQAAHTEPFDPPSTVESTIAESVVTGTDEPEEPHISDYPTVPLAPPQRYFRVNWWSIVACLLLLILLGEHGVPLAVSLASAYVHPTATVTLFPTSKKLTETYQFLAVTGTADQSQQQIPSRLLSFTTPTTTETITTTGVGHTPPVQATGSVTLYNEAPYSQTIDAGTVLTGSDGIHVVTDETVTISAGDGATNGSATVSAHTLQAGRQANIAAFAINGFCCVTGILARNTSRFAGGEDPQSYPTLSQSDVDAATQQIGTTLDPQARDAISSQVKTTEQLLIPITCTYHTLSTPKAGKKAEQASVTVSETCTAQVYDYGALQILTKSQFVKDAGKTAGEHFIQQGILALALAKVTLLDKRHNTYQLTVTAEGSLQFHLTTEQLHAIATQIAGKKLTEAQQAVLRLEGVQGVDIEPAGSTQTSLPTDPGQIAIQVMTGS